MLIEKISAAEAQLIARWARKHAPDLLQMLKIAYLTGGNLALTMRGKVFDRIVGSQKREDSNDESTLNLKDKERAHIRRVLAESRTLKEAAQELGIDGSTLWRKRKRYNLV